MRPDLLPLRLLWSRARASLTYGWDLFPPLYVSWRHDVLRGKRWLTVIVYPMRLQWWAPDANRRVRAHGSENP
jgi:hypothetical protein